MLSEFFHNLWVQKYSGKTHLTNIFIKKFKGIKIETSLFENKNLNEIKIYENIILDNFDQNIDENLFYTLFNAIDQDNKYLIISSPISLKKFKIKLKDLNSRFTSFIDIGIDLPTDDLLRVILTKSFSDKQIQVSNKNIEYILKNIDRSYEKVNLFANSLDKLSLAKAKPINLNLIKKTLGELN